MSYILEALKKAQAERQIGNTPTIHAPTLASAPAGQGARSKRTPVIVAMALMAAAIAGLAAMLVRQQSAANQPPVAVAPAAAAPAAIAPGAAATAPLATAPGIPAAAGTTPVDPAAAPLSIPAAAGAPMAGAPASASASVGIGGASAALATAPARAADAAPGQRSSSLQAASQPTANTRVAQQAAAPNASRAAEAPQLAAPKQAGPAARVADIAQAAPAPAPAPIEEQVQSLRELPEPIQRAIPQVTLGGYMYSKNPADRLLLIDKVLRREGEEVAPGLILDKLQPKQAIFSFRGYRYRVPL